MQQWGGTNWSAMSAAAVQSYIGVPAGGLLAVAVAFPVHYNSPGAGGQYASDPSGNFYFWYGQWFRIGPSGWSATF